MTTHRCSPQHGFTLIELVLVFTIIGIVATVATPRLRWLRNDIDVKTAANDAEALFASARHTAIARASRVTAEIDTVAGTITVRSGRETLHTRALEALYGVTMRSSRVTVTYSPLGVGVGVSNLSLILSKGEAAETLTVSRLGRVKR